MRYSVTTLTLVTAAGVLGVTAGPAYADVTVSPAAVPQGSGQNLTYHYVNDGAQPVSQVTLLIPADSPIAEVYPLSVDDWAPKIDYQQLTEPLKTIHGGTPVTQAPKSITWIAMAGKEIKPGAAADLSVALGPLPTLSSITFSLTGKYADGKDAPAMTTSLSLTPDPDGSVAAAGHAAHGTTGTDTGAGEDAVFQQAVAEARDDARGGSVLSVLGWVVAVLALLGAGATILRNRHRAAEEPDDSPTPDDDATGTAPGNAAGTGDTSAAGAGSDGTPGAGTDPGKEPVAAGRWSLKG